MGAVTDRLTVTLAEAKLYLRVDHDEDDALITDLISAAKSSADAFLNNPFMASDGTPKAIPSEIKTWVLRRVSLLYENRVENLKADQLAGVGTADYGRAISDTSPPLDYALIRPHRLNPGL